MHRYRRLASGIRRFLVLGGDNKKTLFLIIASYALLTLVVTYPLPTRVSVALGGYEDKDAFRYFWLLWWMKHSLLDLHSSPANLTLQYYPLGAYHPLLLLDSYLLLSSFPLNLI